MRIRYKLTPRSLVDGFCLCFFLVIVPLGYIFHLLVSLPYYYHSDSSWVYLLHCVISTFCLVNLVGNYVATVLVDPSIRGLVLQREETGWRLCSSCECFVPPRTWHCDLCRTCVLKRDHHCSFTACCIGYSNERYFHVFLLYFMVCTVYAAYFNLYYMYRTFPGFSWLTILRIVFPLAILLSGIDTSADQLYRMYCVLSCIGAAATTGLFVYHASNALRGRVAYENSKRCVVYDLGDWKENLRQSLGERWYLVWLLPFLESPLPCDGIHWNHFKRLSHKNR